MSGSGGRAPDEDPFRTAGDGSIKPTVYREERPREEFLDVHEHARTHRGTASEVPARILLSWFIVGPYRTRHLERRRNVPRRGGAIIASNHASNLDHFMIEVWMPRHPKFMAKSQLFAAHPLLRLFLKWGAVFPVRRGSEDEDAFETARTVVEQGSLVIMYPEGGRSRTGELGRPRRGVGRIALETGAPVVPTAIVGSTEARYWKRNWPRLRFPPVTVWFGEPMEFPKEPGASRERQQEVSEEIFDRVRDMHARLTSALERHPRRRVLRAGRRGRLGELV